MIIIRADRANAKTVSTQLLTSGMVGAQVKFVFSNEWEGLRKTAVFQVDDKTIDVLDSQWDGNICTIPNECLATSGKTITVGVYGCNEVGDLVIPTVYTKVGRVRLGADPSNDATADSTLPVYEQIRGIIGKLSDLDTVDKSNLVSAINEAAKTEIEIDNKTIVKDEDGKIRTAVGDAVSYTPQELTEDQQVQARKNLGLYYKKTLFDISWDGDTTGKEVILEDYYKVATFPEGFNENLTWLGITHYNSNSTNIESAFKIYDISSELAADVGSIYMESEGRAMFVKKDIVYSEDDDDYKLTIPAGSYFVKTDTRCLLRICAIDEQKISRENIEESVLVGEKGSGNSAEIFNDASNQASGDCSHAEGYSTTASGDCSHAEGWITTASGGYSHAEGYSTTASGEFSHAEGSHTTASGVCSHAEGYQTIASGDSSHAEGKYNIKDTVSKYAHIVGNGDIDVCSNAHTLDWSGNGWFSGDVYVGSTSGKNRDDGSKKLATEEYVDSQKFSGSYNDLTDKPEIPDTTPLIIDYDSPQTDDYTNAIAAFNAGKLVMLKKGNEQFPMSGYDDTHCYFGGSDSAYLPGGYVNAVYAHIGTNSQNYYWYPYKHAVEAAGLYSEDAGNYYTSTSVMGQLQEVGAKLESVAKDAQSITKIESLDESNIKTFRSLEDGTYILDGYFTPYTGSDSTLIFDPPALASISSTESATHVQIFEAYDNQVQHLIITDTSCEKTEVLLNEIAKSAAGIGDLTALKTTAKDTIVDAINEAASVIPAVTASDNGKVLSVSNGQWEVADAPSGGSSTDVSLGITEAYKGYGIRVKAIDENNRPTEWEAVDEQPIPLHMGNSDGTIIRFCAVPVETLTPTSAYELAKSCLMSANTKLWYSEGPTGALISEKPAALILTVSEDDTNIYAWYISKDGTVKSVATPKSIFTATE